MGENVNLQGLLHAIDKTTGEEFEIKEIPKLASGGIGVDFGDLDWFEDEIIISLKTISKKRFKKLLMGMGYQRNCANRMHNEYMKYYRSRTIAGLLVYENMYKNNIIEFIKEI